MAINIHFLDQLFYLYLEHLFLFLIVALSSLRTSIYQIENCLSGNLILLTKFNNDSPVILIH